MPAVPPPIGSQFPQIVAILRIANRIVSSGLFFMIVGTAFLAAAYTTIGRTHAAMTFVFVVVGVAILLFGTGTQGIGSFDSGDQQALARYKVTLAGGAGALAFAVAAGFVAFDGPIKSAFRVEKDYVRIAVKGNGIEPSDIGLYIPTITVNGEPAAAAVHGDYVEAYVPYLLTGQEQTIVVAVQLYLAPDQEGRNLASLDPKPRQKEYSILVDDQGRVSASSPGDGTVGLYIREAGYDFPRLILPDPIDLTVQRIKGTNIEAR